MKWEDLVKIGNLCSGAPLVALVFCCGSKKSCLFREKALEMLGITEDQYIVVKEKHKIEAKGTCYGNLAYCCSLNEPCDVRDKALREHGMTPAEYLQYKFEILKDLIPKDKMKQAFEKRVLYKFAFEMVRVDDMDGRGYRGLALGNPELVEYLMILDCKPIKLPVAEVVKEKVRKSEFISVRVSKELYQQIAEIASKKGCNISDIVREALNLYLTMNLSKPMEAELSIEERKIHGLLRKTPSHRVNSKIYK